MAVVLLLNRIDYRMVTLLLHPVDQIRDMAALLLHASSSSIEPFAEDELPSAELISAFCGSMGTRQVINGCETIHWQVIEAEKDCHQHYRDGG